MNNVTVYICNTCISAQQTQAQIDEVKYTIETDQHKEVFGEIIQREIGKGESHGYDGVGEYMLSI